MFFLQAHLALDEIRYQYQPIMSLIYKTQDVRWLTFNLGLVLLLDVAQDLVDAVDLVVDPGGLKLFSLVMISHGGPLRSISTVGPNTTDHLSSNSHERWRLAANQREALDTIQLGDGARWPLTHRNISAKIVS